jgi:hypothetical protein
MEQRLRVLQDRELVTREEIEAKLSELLADIMPRAHLHVIEHGNPATIRAEISLAFLPDQTEATVSMVLVPTIPRACRTTKLEFKADENSVAP